MLCRTEAFTFSIEDSTNHDAQTLFDRRRAGARRRYDCGPLRPSAKHHVQGHGQGRPPSADRKVKNAEEDRIEADAKAAKAKCETMKDNAKDVCEKEAKAKEKVAKAELNAKNNPTPSNQRKVAEAKAEGEYDVAKEKCDDMKGNEKRRVPEGGQGEA